MPSIKHRTRIIAQNFISSSGLHADLWYPWQDFFIAASSRSMAASIAVYDMSGSMGAIIFQSTKCSCPLWVQQPTPTNLAVAAPAAASGQVLVDWSNASTTTASATWVASLIWIPPGSAIGDTGTCTLGSACSTVVGTSACEWNSSSLFNFTTPASKNGWLGVRIFVNTGDAGTSTCTVFGGVRVRYLADRIGS